MGIHCLYFLKRSMSDAYIKIEIELYDLLNC